MKKLAAALAFAATFAVATPAVLACPGHDRTADKTSDSKLADAAKPKKDTKAPVAKKDAKAKDAKAARTKTVAKN